MGIDIRETLLPGVGLRYEFDNADGDRVCVIARRRGEFEFFVSTAADPDRAQRVFRLTVRRPMHWPRSWAPHGWSRASPT